MKALREYIRWRVTWWRYRRACWAEARRYAAVLARQRGGDVPWGLK